jgi:hypothetical protein
MAGRSLLVGMERYRLIDHETGADLGPFVSPRMTFAIGEAIARRPEERFEIVRVVKAEEHEDFRAYVVVQRLTDSGVGATALLSP